MITFSPTAAALAFCAIATTACVPSSEIRRANTAPAPTATTVAVQTTAVASATSAVKSTEAIALQVFLPGNRQGDSVARQIRFHLYTKLRAQNRFTAVKPVGAEARYDMDVRILNIDTVSAGERYLLSVFAGGDKLAAAVKVTDRTTSKVVSEFEVFSEASVWENAEGHGFAAAIDELVDQIILNL